MLRPGRILIVVGVAILSLDAFLWFASGSPSFRHCVQETATEQSAQNNESSQKDRSFFTVVGVYRDCTGQFVRKDNGAITALATILLTFVTMMLAWVAYRQYTTTRAQLRAYVGIDYAEILPPPTVALGFRARIVIKNYGQTPAYKVVLRRRVKTVGIAVLKQADRDLRGVPGTPPTTIGTQASFGVGIDTILGTEEFEGLILETTVTMIFGDIQYVDIFNRQWTEEFSLRVHHFGKEHQRIAPWSGEGELS